ncbi:hypothetical protein TNCV_3766511 [Trichonephila clavipes]|nr:hypothetical protein TNCV_3766511 [Trichonephila clavipes]
MWPISSAEIVEVSQMVPNLIENKLTFSKMKYLLLLVVLPCLVLGVSSSEEERQQRYAGAEIVKGSHRFSKSIESAAQTENAVLMEHNAVRPLAAQLVKNAVEQGAVPKDKGVVAPGAARRSRHVAPLRTHVMAARGHLPKF